MAFETEQSRNPTSILMLEINLMDWGNDNQEAKFMFLVGDEVGEVMAKRTGDLLPHLTTQQKIDLKAFVDAMRTLAEQTIQ